MNEVTSQLYLKLNGLRGKYNVKMDSLFLFADDKSIHTDFTRYSN